MQIESILKGPAVKRPALLVQSEADAERAAQKIKTRYVVKHIQ